MNILAVILAATAPMATRQAATNIAEHVVAEATPGIISAAKSYTDTATNALLSSACAYTDAAVADIGVDMSAVTNIAQEAAQTAQERAVADAKANTTAATNALSAALTAAIPTDNAQLANGAGYVTASVTNGLLAVETDPNVPAWAKAASAPLPPDYATVSNRAMTAVTEAQLEGYKQKQEAVDDPAIDGMDIVAAAIVSITQDANGVIAPVKKILPTATADYGGQDGLMSGADKAKLDGIEAGAQVNTIEGISVNGESVEPADKVVELAIPTVPENVSSFDNDAGYVTKSVTNGLLAADAAAATYQPKGDYLTEHQPLTPATNYTDSATSALDASLSSRLSLASLAATNYTDFAIGAAIANTNPVFSNAVLSVGLGIDTNTVAAINALVEAGDELPIGGATSVGALLLALAAAVAALKRTKADASALRYAMPESVALVAENDAATLVCADRAVTNATIASGFSTLNLSFPAAVSGYVRDFYLRITVAAGESAPALSIPQGVTIENPDGAVPEIADGEASAAATTLVWFSETAPGIFTAKSETVKAVV